MVFGFLSSVFKPHCILFESCLLNNLAIVLIANFVEFYLFSVVAMELDHFSVQSNVTL